MNVQENYEQLKRRNRRRLVGALIMVVIAAILLAIMLSRRTPQPVSAPQLDIRAAGASSAASEDASADATMDSQSTSAVVLEPIASTPASAVTLPATSITTTPAPLAGVERKPQGTVSGSVSAPNAIPVRTPVRAQATQQNGANSAHNKPSADNRVVTSVPVDKKNIEKNQQHSAHSVPDSRAKAAITKPAETVEKNAVAKPAKKAPTAAESRKNSEAVSTSRSATAKTGIAENDKKTITAPKTINKTPAPVKPANTDKPVNNATDAKSSTRAGRLTPQQILENKAAGAVTKNSASNQKGTSATSTSNSKATVERTVIQIGAYTTEAQANLVQQRLAVAGVPTSISTSQTSKGTLYRVRSRVYNSRNQALQNLEKVHAVGLDGLVIGL
jgi:colicin import membrane protein